MKPPYVSLENASEVSDYFIHKYPNRPLMRSVHVLSRLALGGRDYFELGADEEIEEHTGSGGQVLMVHNHQAGDFDPFYLASLIERQRALRDMRTRTVIPAKPDTFNNPWYGWVVRNSGAIPALRPWDVKPNSDTVQATIAETLRRKSNDATVDIMIDRFNHDFHGAIYIEGTRNKYDPITVEAWDSSPGQDQHFARLLPPQRGVGRVALGVERPENIAIVCVASVRGMKHDKIRNPTNYISRPFQAAQKDIETVVDLAAQTLQAGLDRAVAIVVANAR